MLDLVSLKSGVLGKLNLLKEELKNSNHPYKVIRFELSSLSFLELFHFSNSYPKCFFNNKDNITSYLGIGAHHIFNRKESFATMIDIADKFPQVLMLGAQCFDDSSPIRPEWNTFGNFFYFIPQCFFEKKSDAYSFNVIISKDNIKSEQSWMEFLLDIESNLTFTNPSLIDSQVIERKSFPDKTKWEKNINDCLGYLQNKCFDKVVMARKEVIYFDHPINEKKASEILLRNPDAYQVILSANEHNTFFSNTPEMLFKKALRSIEVDCIAGTRKRSNNHDEDAKLAQELLESFKEQNEHQLVALEISEKLFELCDLVKQLKKNEILKLKNVQHLFGLFAGQLKKNTNFAQILNTLHPTPAVGGRPWNKVKALIKELEGFKRGFYAAPVGFIKGDQAEFCVGIRSGLIHGNELHIYGGAGIVADSNAGAEWDETTHKMENFTSSFS